jgi:hypothetical protein
VIIGVTDEAVDVVDKWIVTKKKTGYPIVILDGALEKTLGVQHFPFTGVIDPDGNLSYAGDSPEAALKKAMKAARPGSIWPKKLIAAAMLVRNGKLIDAWAELQTVKTAGGLDDKEQKTHEKFSSFVTDTSTSIVKLSEDLFKQDMIYAAVQKAEPIANAKPALPATEAAQKLLGEMKAVPTYDAEMKGGESFAGAVAKEESKEYLDAFNAFKDISKKAQGTKIAALALKRAEQLMKDGMPGYEPACEKCMKAKKACVKHAKPVKL